MWREFFGPQARIIGVDLNPNAKKWEEEGFEIFIGSQSDKNFWKDFTDKVGPIDAVLDDGGHTYEQQIITTEMLIDSVKDGGVIAVEDTHTSYMDGFGAKKFSFMAYVKMLQDKINYRFSELDQEKADTRIWYISVFESIVALHINRKASQLPSEVTVNNGVDDAAEDFRYSGDKVTNSMNKMMHRMRSLKSVPGARFLKTKIIDTVVASRSSKSIRDYFK